MNLLVACLCAAWCGTCKAYQATFDAVAREFPQHRFLWVDIEDRAELFDAIDIENFPTLLITDEAGRVCFAGTITPQVETLRRLCGTATSGGLKFDAGDEHWRELARRLVAPVLEN